MARNDENRGEDSLATRASLLGRLRNWDDAPSWEEFTQTYSRLIRAVAMKAGLTEAEAKDVEQETLLSVAKTIHEFQSDPTRGSFKSWLLNLTRWRITDQFRRRGPANASLAAPGGSSESVPPAQVARSSDGTRTGTPTVERVAAPDQLDAQWEIEWKRNVLETALARVGRKVKPKHLQIFDLYSRRHWGAAKVARELGVTMVQVYLVNHRITKLLRKEVDYLGQKLE